LGRQAIRRVTMPAGSIGQSTDDLGSETIQL
jgi:hypothetical protein